MAKSRLTTQEKYTIQGMVADSKTHKEIASLLGRREKTVQKYVEGELDKIHATVAKVAIDNTTPIDKNVSIRPKATSVEQLISDAVHMVKQNGLDKEDAQDLVDTAMIIATENERVFKTSKQLADAAMRRLSVKHLMGRKAEGGRKGIAVMSKAASERGDGSTGKTATGSRNTRGAIYDTKGKVKS